MPLGVGVATSHCGSYDFSEPEAEPAAWKRSSGRPQSTVVSKEANHRVSGSATSSAAWPVSAGQRHVPREVSTNVVVAGRDGEAGAEISAT